MLYYMILSCIFVGVFVLLPNLAHRNSWLTVADRALIVFIPLEAPCEAMSFFSHLISNCLLFSFISIDQRVISYLAYCMLFKLLRKQELLFMQSIFYGALNCSIRMLHKH